MSMRIRIIETDTVVEYENSYAIRLIEQGVAIPEDGTTPVTPDEPEIVPSQYGGAIMALQATCASLQQQIDSANQGTADDKVFADMAHSILQAEVRMLEYNGQALQEKVEAMGGV